MVPLPLVALIVSLLIASGVLTLNYLFPHSKPYGKREKAKGKGQNRKFAGEGESGKLPEIRI